MHGFNSYTRCIGEDALADILLKYGREPGAFFFPPFKNHINSAIN